MDEFGRLSPLEGVFPGPMVALATFEDAILLPICKNEFPYEGDAADVGIFNLMIYILFIIHFCFYLSLLL